MSKSPAPPSRPTSAAGGDAPAPHRHIQSAVDRQRAQLEKLLKDPAKPAYIPPPPKDKTVRPPREMMKNVQGSSAGAGSGEFHVYKASRRREYERLKLIEEEAQKEAVTAEFERKRKESEEQASAKTSKNRAKRQKKKERAKGKAGSPDRPGEGHMGETNVPNAAGENVVIKKRRLVNGKELLFKIPGEASDGEDDEGDGPRLDEGSQFLNASEVGFLSADGEPPRIAEEPKIVIHEDD